MTETSTMRWQRRINVAEKAVRGDQEALAPLREEVLRLTEDTNLLNTPTAACDMSYFVALLPCCPVA